MSNLMDYLDWRGDLTFREAPFNEVDNLILAQLVYVEFAGIVPAPGEEGTITVKEACELFFAAHDRKEIMERVSMTENSSICAGEDGADRAFLQCAVIWLYQRYQQRGTVPVFCGMCPVG